MDDESRMMNMMRLSRLRASDPPPMSIPTQQQMEEALAGGGSWLTLEQVQHQQQQRRRGINDHDGDEFSPLPPLVPPPYFAGDIVSCVSEEGMVGGEMVDESVVNYIHIMKAMFCV